MSNYSIYIRVSTTKQGTSGLGLQAQLDKCQSYIDSVKGTTDKVFKDVQSGKSRHRKGLWDAIAHCKETGSTLVIAKLDRLARDVEFTFKIKNTGVNIYFCDMPICNTMVLSVLAGLAEYEAGLISTRTKDSLAVKKAQGIKLGRPKGCKASQNAIGASVSVRKDKAKANPHNIAFKNYLDVFESKNGLISNSKSISEFVQDLNRMGYKTAKGLPFNISRAWSMIYQVRKLFVA